MAGAAATEDEVAALLLAGLVNDPNVGLVVLEGDSAMAGRPLAVTTEEKLPNMGVWVGTGEAAAAVPETREAVPNWRRGAVGQPPVLLSAAVAVVAVIAVADDDGEDFYNQRQYQ